VKTSVGVDQMVYAETGDLTLTNGDVFADAFFYNSDITLKENIKPVSGLENILKLQGIQFNWKESGAPDVGLSAQNVEEIFPDLVSTDPTTHLKSVKYLNLVAPLIEAVKDQQNQIEVLKKEIEEFKAQRF